MQKYFQTYHKCFKIWEEMKCLEILFMYGFIHITMKSKYMWLEDSYV